MNCHGWRRTPQTLFFLKRILTGLVGFNEYRFALRESLLACFTTGVKITTIRLNFYQDTLFSFLSQLHNQTSHLLI